MLSIRGLRRRARLFAAIRGFFGINGFLEVDTPIRQPLLIPEANIIPMGSEGWFLQSSPELCMKRLLAAGCERIFQICHCFRAAERGRIHLEEFVLLEWYRLDADYLSLMDDCERLLRWIGSRMDWGDDGLSLAGPFDRLTVREAFQQYSPVSMNQALEEDRFDAVLVESIEPNLGRKRPLFLYDYPAQLATLARLKTDDRSVAERFELYLQGVELANGFSELTDPVEQRQRFTHERRAMARQGIDMEMPERFLDDLKKIDTAAGIAFGLDRLLMLILGVENINHAISFAHHDLS